MTKYVVLSLVSADPERYFGCTIAREGDPYLMIYRVAYGPASYWECSEWMGFNCKPIPAWWADKKTVFSNSRRTPVKTNWRRFSKTEKSRSVTSTASPKQKSSGREIS